MTWWSMAFVVVILLTALGFAVWGVYEYSPSRVRNVKYYERNVLAEHIDLGEVARTHPEIIRTTRLDRHPAFLVPHVCVLAYTICVFAGVQLTSNVAALGTGPRYTMATCFLIGSLLVLCGAALGMRVGPWVVKCDVANHPTAAVLGDDVSLPYRLSMAGMFAMIVSSSIYAWVSFQSTSGSLGGWLTVGIVVWCVMCIGWFHLSVQRFMHWDATIMAEYTERIHQSED